MLHIHLQPLGGAAGDMFVACMLDAFPEHRDLALHAASLAGVACRAMRHSDGTLTGQRFLVDDERLGHRPHHHHTDWRTIKAGIERSALPASVRAHAVGIFAVLAEAEGRVHGIEPEAVTFHEVGAADSIADILAAAALIDAVSPARWTVSALPVGGGIVQTAHGPMPVPAPATARLLEGFAHHDDGIAGERVTPTGAAILRYLVRDEASRGGAETLRRSGYGFGARTLPGISNCLRALVYEDAAVAAPAGHRELAVISFEVDDLSGEELAHGLERVRAAPGVHDVVVMTAFGKKSRMAIHVQVLSAPDTLEDVVASCFRETTTIGLRTHLVQGRALPRRFVEVMGTSGPLAVKIVERPGANGTPVLTGKAEADQVRGITSHAGRVRARQAAERDALERDATKCAGGTLRNERSAR